MQWSAWGYLFQSSATLLVKCSCWRIIEPGAGSWLSFSFGNSGKSGVVRATWQRRAYEKNNYWPSDPTEERWRLNWRELSGVIWMEERGPLDWMNGWWRLVLQGKKYNMANTLSEAGLRTWNFMHGISESHQIRQPISHRYDGKDLATWKPPIAMVLWTRRSH